MLNHASRPLRSNRRQRSLLSNVVAGAALFIALGGSAFAANSLIGAGDIAPGAVTSKAIKNGGIKPKDLSATTQESLQGDVGAAGAKGATGLTGATGDTGLTGLTGTSGANGANGANGPNGTNGIDGINGLNGTDGIDGLNATDGIDGTNGLAGADGTNGTNGLAGADGTNGTNGLAGEDGTNGLAGEDGTNGTNGVDGTDGIDGIIAPLSATSGEKLLPTNVGPATTVVLTLTVPAGNYVVLAKSQLSHTGAGDTVDCFLKAGGVTIDQVSMKTLPALAAIPVSLQAVTTTSPTQFTLECDVSVANGAANFNSLIAIPIG